MIEHLAIATHQMPEWSGDKAGDEGRYKVFVTSSAKRAGVSGEKKTTQKIKGERHRQRSR